MIRQIVKANKWPIGLVVAFVLVENISWIIEPSFFGNLLDGLIDDFYDHENVNYMLPLFIWIGIYVVNVLGGSLSRYYSGKIYARIYADVATDIIMKSGKKKQSASKMLVRTELAKEYVSFLQDRIPDVLWQVVASLGGIIALFFYDWRIAGVCLLVVLPIVWINRMYNKHVTKHQTSLHDTREEIYKVIENKNSERVHEHYHSMVGPQIKIAKWNSFDFGIVKILLMLVFIVVLFICVDVDKFSTGNIYSIVAYLWTFITSTEYLPGLMESLTSVKELNTRMQDEG